MGNVQKILIEFAGVDYFERAVFRTPDRKHFFKSVELMPQNNFSLLSQNEKERLLSSLHTTDEFEGEPNYPVNRKYFDLKE